MCLIKESISCFFGADQRNNFCGEMQLCGCGATWPRGEFNPNEKGKS
jgi:hypothetical protein